jgi:hypothetical protein
VKPIPFERCGIWVDRPHPPSRAADDGARTAAARPDAPQKLAIELVFIVTVTACGYVAT